GLQVVGHLLPSRAPGAPSRVAPAGQLDGPRRGEQTERVIARTPRTPDPVVRVEDHERPARLLEVVSGSQASLPCAHDHRVEPLRTLAVHGSPPAPVASTTVGGRARGVIARTSQPG